MTFMRAKAFLLILLHFALVFREANIGHVSTSGDSAKVKLEKTFAEVAKLRMKQGLTMPEIPYTLSPQKNLETKNIPTLPHESPLETSALQQTVVTLDNCGWDKSKLQRKGILLLRRVLSIETVHSSEFSTLFQSNTGVCLAPPHTHTHNHNHDAHPQKFVATFATLSGIEIHLVTLLTFPSLLCWCYLRITVPTSMQAQQHSASIPAEENKLRTHIISLSQT